MRRSGYDLLPAIGAILKVLTLAFNPFTQRIIRFPQQNVLNTNITASVPIATRFNLRNVTKQCSSTFPLYICRCAEVYGSNYEDDDKCAPRICLKKSTP